MTNLALTLFFLTASLESAMTHEPQALALQVVDNGPQVEVQLLANSPRAQEVSYTLEVTGKSTSKHRGKTSLAAGAKHVLSTIKASKDDDWCARVVVEEEGREPYELSEGSCA